MDVQQQQSLHKFWKMSHARTRSSVQTSPRKKAILPSQLQTDYGVTSVYFRLAADILLGLAHNIVLNC